MSDYIAAEGIVSQVRKMPVQERACLKAILYSDNEIKASLKERLTGQRFAKGWFCPHCGGHHVRRNGHREDGIQKYICAGCGKSFTIMTNSIFSGTRKGIDEWQGFMRCMADGKSLDSSAVECGMTHAAAFGWRHKLLDALSEAGDDTVLGGVVEADEAFFPVSYKGNSKHFDGGAEREPRRRGGEVHTGGLSDELVCVPCAVDGNGDSASLVAKLGKCSEKALDRVLGGRISPESMLCSDGDASYDGFVRSNGISLVRNKGGKKSVGAFDIQRINSCHSHLRLFVGRFRGVSTKYLNNYLIWNNAVRYCKVYVANKLSLMFEAAASAMLSIRSADLGKRSSLPLLVQIQLLLSAKTKKSAEIHPRSQ